MKLISAEDELGDFFYKKVSKLVDEIVQSRPGQKVPGTNWTWLDTETTDEVLGKAGIRTFCYDGPRRDFFETGAEAAMEAAEKGTNLVLTWNDTENELVAVLAEDEAEAKKKIMDARKELLAIRKAPARKSARSARTKRRR